MIITYDECALSRLIIADAFDICVKYPDLRAGICCASLQQLRTLERDIDEVFSELPPWYAESNQIRRSGSTYSETIQLDNGSILEIFVANDSTRGKRFHYLRVDESIESNIKEHILRFLVRNYSFDHKEIEPECLDLLDFARNKLNAPLLHWQSEMLISLFKGGVCQTGRNLGKQTISCIYKQWLNQTSEKCDDCEYTYDQVMAGIPTNTTP